MSNKNANQDYIDSSDIESDDDSSVADQKAEQLVSNIKSILKKTDEGEGDEQVVTKAKTKFVRKEVKFIGRHYYSYFLANDDTNQLTMADFVRAMEKGQPDDENVEGRVGEAGISSAALKKQLKKLTKGMCLYLNSVV